MEVFIMKKILKFLLAAVVLVSTSCATILTTKKDPVLMPDSMEYSFGLSTKAQVDANYKAYANTAVNNYVKELGAKLAASSARKGVKYEFHTVDSPEVNAFAVPGGFVYVTSGIIKALEDEAQLAAVIGHEIGHIDRHHGIKKLQRHIIATQGFSFLEGLISGGKEEQKNELAQIAANAGIQLLFMKNSRENEFEADEQGAYLASKAGYDPTSIVDVQNYLLKLRDRKPSALEQMLSTHPISEERIAHAEGYIKETGLAGSVRNKAQYDKIKALIK